MRLPVRFAPVLFGVLLSAIMIAPWVRRVVTPLTA